MQHVLTGLQIQHAFDFSLHAIEIPDELGDFFLVFILDFEQYDVADHGGPPLKS